MPYDSLATRTHVDTRDRSRSRSPAPPAANPTHFEDDAEKIARRAMEVAAEVCVFTNDRVTVETIS